MSDATPADPSPPAAEPSLSALCAEIKAALAKATPGPWRLEMHEPYESGDPVPFVLGINQSHDTDSVCDAQTYYPQAVTVENAALIVLLANSASRLVAAVEEMEAELIDIKGRMALASGWMSEHVPNCGNRLTAEMVLRGTAAPFDYDSLKSTQAGMRYIEICLGLQAPHREILAKIESAHQAEVTALQAKLAIEEADRASQSGIIADLSAELDLLRATLADAEATADRWRDVRALLAGARLPYSVGGIDGARSVLKQMFDAYDAALAPSSARPEQGGA